MVTRKETAPQAKSELKSAAKPRIFVPMAKADDIVDVLVVGGGVNGTGIARDASGRGLSVILCEQNDLASGTSSKATKLFHGGLRYLEQFDFLLVRKALIEREVLLQNMPHISRPMRFVLPHVAGMRPAWLLRLGLFMYDHLGGRKLLPPTKGLDLRRDVAGIPLKPGFRKGFEYSDGWVDDARLVVLNARDAADRGAKIRPQTQVAKAVRDADFWRVTVIDKGSGQLTEIKTKALINAAGPWVSLFMEQALGRPEFDRIRLVRGSHIVVKKLFDHDRAYIFQNPDGRIIFAIPFEEDFTLIGTTDQDHSGSPSDVECSEEEKSYLCLAASEYFAKPVSAKNIVWTYSGVRPLDDDLGVDAKDASRDYQIKIDDQNGKAPLISIYGGKITTFRKLSEQVVAELALYAELTGRAWTNHTPLPGGDFTFDDGKRLQDDLAKNYPFLEPRCVHRLFAAYGTQAGMVMGDAKSHKDLGMKFGGGLSEREVRWLMQNEWAKCADDIVWRRSKLGLRMTKGQIGALDRWIAEKEK